MFVEWIRRRPSLAKEDSVAAENILERAHNAFLDLPRRAERIDDEALSTAFVDTPPLLRRVAAGESQIVFGRRGTGKTHVLKHAARQQKGKNSVSSYIDLRLVGSNQSIYGDTSLELTERATRLVIDVLTALGQTLHHIAVQLLDEDGLATIILPLLEDMSSVLTDVRVVGTIEEKETNNTKSADDVGLSASISSKGPSLSASAGSSRASEGRTEITNAGVSRYHLSFGNAQNSFSNLIAALPVDQIHYFIDEWSEIPLDLQPLLADALRKILLTNAQISIKIAAIEHRTRLIQHLEGNQYIGFELGADIPTGLNLDDFLVFDNDQDKAVDFFRKLLLSHLKLSDPAIPIASPAEFQRQIFTERRAFDEFVRAVEGVPRDALNLISILAEKKYGRKFGVPDVRAAAREWYTRDKAAVIDSKPELSDFLLKIINEVIRGRRARAFLVKSSAKDARIETLFDLRLLHILKRNVSSNDFPGVRFDVYKFDYGCYVDLISTASNPEGLFQEVDGSWIDVPADDYRSIRRAVLDLEAF